MSEHEKIQDELLELSHFLGQENRNLAILGEGNTSAKTGDQTFFVKASGSCLETLAKNEIVECNAEKLMAMLDLDEVSDTEIESYLMESRVDPAARKPSVETLFHAYLLSLPGVNFVGHTHSTAVNQVLCSPLAESFAKKRLFPDDVVCCGPESVLVPYTDPGLKLSQFIRKETVEFMEKNGGPPKVILLENHGIITMGKTPGTVKAAMLMAHKSAQIFVGAAALGGPIFMDGADVDRIANRSDEHYRQRVLKM